MAKIVTIPKPLPGPPAPVGQLDHTAQGVGGAVAIAPQLSNPNLLDNWYFGNPVNQRGQTTYTTSSDEYTIDRWMKSAGTLNIEDGYISASLTDQGSIVQYIEPDLFKAIAGKTLTFSVLHQDGQLKKTTFTPDSNYTNTDLWIGLGGEYGTMIYRWSGGHPNLVYTNSQNGELVAVKLELGDQQTLAHQENGVWMLNEIPDYGEQLRRCQRYFQRITGVLGSGFIDTNTLAYVSVIIPVMRSVPTISPKSDASIRIRHTGSPVTSTIIEAINVYTRGCILRATTSGLTKGQGCVCQTSEGEYIDFIADL